MALAPSLLQPANNNRALQVGPFTSPRGEGWSWSQYLEHLSKVMEQQQYKPWGGFKSLHSDWWSDQVLVCDWMEVCLINKPSELWVVAVPRGLARHGPPGSVIGRIVIQPFLIGETLRWSKLMMLAPALTTRWSPGRANRGAVAFLEMPPPRRPCSVLC